MSVAAEQDLALLSALDLEKHGVEKRDAVAITDVLTVWVPPYPRRSSSHYQSHPFSESASPSTVRVGHHQSKPLSESSAARISSGRRLPVPSELLPGPGDPSSSFCCPPRPPPIGIFRLKRSTSRTHGGSATHICFISDIQPLSKSTIRVSHYPSQPLSGSEPVPRFESPLSVSARLATAPGPPCRPGSPRRPGPPVRVRIGGRPAGLARTRTG